MQLAADGGEGFLYLVENRVVGGAAAVEGRGVGAFEGVDCDGWFGALDGGGICSSCGEGNWLDYQC